MLAKRLIPCLDVDGGRVVKGTKFQDMRDAGDPVQMAGHYDREGADELVFLDITATVEGRTATLDVISRTAEQVFIPLTVGGGVRTEDDVNELLRAGADKVSMNSAAVREPATLQRCADRFGTQCMVIAIDAKRRAVGDGWEVFIDAGRTGTGRDAIEWAVEATTERGAGEVLLTSMDRDGTGEGYDLGLLRELAASRACAGDRERGGGRPRPLRRGPARGRRRRGAGGEPVAPRPTHDPRDQAVPAVEGPRGAAVTEPIDRSPVGLDGLRFDERGLIPVIAQDAETGQVLMMAWANREALERTLAEGRMVYWSRSRAELWRKGDTSGHVQHWDELRVDCDADVLLARIHQEGAACHTGERSCFFRPLAT